MIKLRQLIFEAIDETDINVISNSQNVSIMYRTDNIRSSVASIDRIEDHLWWISRVLVGEETSRGQGIGSYLLQRAVKEVLKQDPHAKILVEPGGYSDNIEQQINFYRKNGFVDAPEFIGSLIYGGNQ